MGKLGYVKEIKEECKGKDEGIIGSKLNKLHSVHLLEVYKVAIKDNSNKVKKTNLKTVGVKLETDIDITVPDIDASLDYKAGIPKDKIGEREIKAGETFNLNMNELAFLV